MSESSGSSASRERSGFTLGELGRLALLPFRGPGLLSKWLFGLAAALVPFVGWTLLGGYQVRVARSALGAEPETLPAWEDLRGFAIDCFRVFAVWILFHGVFRLPVFFIAQWLNSAGSGQGTSQTLHPAFQALVVGSLALFYLLLPLAAQQIAAGRLGEAFNLPGHLRRVWRRPLLCALLAAGCASLWIPTEVLMALPFAVTAPLSFWAFSVTGALIGTAGRKIGVAVEPPESATLALSRPDENAGAATLQP